MVIEESQIIQGLKTIQPHVFTDNRGEFFELYSTANNILKEDQGKLLVFKEDDLSISRKNVLRGLHGDRKTSKLVQCLFGSLYFVVVDMREKSPSLMKWQAFEINETNRLQLFIPSGCANGHLVLTEKSILLYKQSEVYLGSANQFTVRWDDPKLDICWPIKNPILSERDANAEYLK